MLKKLKMDSSTPSVFAVDPSRNYSTQAKGETKSATIQDAQDQVADESFAPGGDADYFAEEDGEGRFFGGGLTSEQKTILNIFDKSVGEGIQDVVSAIYQWMFSHLTLQSRKNYLSPLSENHCLILSAV
jgi:beta-catenin-like protein 1